MHFALILIALLSPAMVHAGAACPSDFRPFIQQFERSASVQIANTKFPLKYSQIDQDDPEMKMKHVLVQRWELQNIENYPSKEYRRKLGLVRTLHSGFKNKCTVTFIVPESDAYAVNFKFQREKGRWQLIEVEDNSL